MNRSSVGVFALTAVLTMATAGCARGARNGAPSPQPDARIDSTIAVATFDTVWSTINTSYYDSTFGDLSWVTVRRQLRPRAALARTDSDLRDVLDEMLERLGVSHFGIVPAGASRSVTKELKISSKVTARVTLDVFALNALSEWRGASWIS